MKKQNDPFVFLTDHSCLLSFNFLLSSCIRLLALFVNLFLLSKTNTYKARTILIDTNRRKYRRKNEIQFHNLYINYKSRSSLTVVRVYNSKYEYRFIFFFTFILTFLSHLFAISISFPNALLQPAIFFSWNLYTKSLGVCQTEQYVATKFMSDQQNLFAFDRTTCGFVCTVIVIAN